MKTLKATKLAFLIAALSGGAICSHAVAEDRRNSDALASESAAQAGDVSAPSAYGTRDTVPNDEFLSDEADTRASNRAAAAGAAETSSELNYDSDAARPETESGAAFSSTDRSSAQSDNERDRSSSDTSDLGRQAAHQVHFEFDSAELSDEARSSLDQLAEQLKDEDRPLTVSISGYTDNSGPTEYNKDLAERRAKAVQDYFKDKEIKVSNWDINAPGEESPVASNESREGRQENRRVEIDLMGSEAGDREVSAVTD